jgi:hypothetical protein
MFTMIKRSVQILSSVGFVVSAFWVWHAPTWEPTIALIASLVTFLGTLTSIEPAHGLISLVRRFKRRVPNLIHSLLKRLLGMRYRRFSPEVRLAFHWPICGDSRKHEIVSGHLWDEDSPSMTMVATHFGPGLDPYDFLVFDGHTPSFELRDLDGDGDGKVEIYAWNRSYNQGPIANTVTRYVFQEGSLQKDATFDYPSEEIRIPPP